MVKNSSQNGSVHTVIIVSLVAALIGSLGFIFWQNFTATQPVRDEKAVVTLKTTETIVEENKEIFLIPEMGISIDVTNLSQTLRYSIERNDGLVMAKLGTVETHDQCQDGYMGSIVKVKGEIPQGLEPQYTTLENGEIFQYLFGQYDGYYLRYINAQNPCQLRDGSLFPQKELSLEVGRAIKSLSIE